MFERLCSSVIISLIKLSTHPLKHMLRMLSIHKCDLQYFIFLCSEKQLRGQTSYASINQLLQPQFGLQRGKVFLVNFLKLSKNIQKFLKLSKKSWNLSTNLPEIVCLYATLTPVWVNSPYWACCSSCFQGNRTFTDWWISFSGLWVVKFGCFFNWKLKSYSYVSPQKQVLSQSRMSC